MSISGRKLTAFSNGQEISGNNSWQVEETGDVLDATVGSDRGYEREDMGVRGFHVTIKGYHDVSTGSLDTFGPGEIIGPVDLYRDIDDATPAYSIIEALVVRFRLGAEVRGRFEFEMEIHSRGNVVTYNDP